MASSLRALALWCAVIAYTVAYTIDCNHDYTDCETEFGKFAINDGDHLLPLSSELVTEKTEPLEAVTTTSSTTTTITTTTTTPIPSTTTAATTVATPEATESNSKPKPRLLNLNVDELQNFANILHNQTDSKNSKKFFSDLSDVDLDAEDDEETSLEHEHDERHGVKIPDKFYSNLQEPFHPLLNVDRTDDSETCTDNGVTYKVGEKINRGCDETCECMPGGQLECAPRCQSPFIRRGRRLNDPLCFESPVDECCSIIACATGNDAKPTSVEVCHYNNITYTVGGKWNIGCEQTCTCEKESVVTCTPRCNRLPQSEKCINVQDPKDECCEVQVCDVSQDVHEELDNSTNTAEVSKEHNEMSMEKSTMRPLVLMEPIGSIKVLHNNSVQVNLMHTNSSDDPIHLQLSDNNGLTYKDVELKYSNLILNLEGGKDYILKTKETGTKFNFTIISTDGNELPMEDLQNKTKFGCYHDDKYYEVGEEFQIGCSEICECTGQDTKECAPMVCPSHVGLEIVSKSCVQWAPNPPPVPPNCCPRTARCLSDGTCHYKGVPVPNWSKVPIELTGCEEHCFCENGELDCQEVCSPLPPLPPQNLRCPPMHRPAPMNVSDEDCCKEWGCVPHAGLTNGSSLQPLSTYYQNNYVTPNSPVLSSYPKFVLPIPPTPTESINFNKHNIFTPFKFIHNNIKTTTSYINNGPFDYHKAKLPKLQHINSTELPIKQKNSVFYNINPSKLNYNVFANFINFSKPVSHAQNSLYKPSEIKNENYNVKTTQSTSTPININKISPTSLPLYNKTKINNIFEHQSSLKKVPLSEIDDLNLYLPIYKKKFGHYTNGNNESKTSYFDDLPNEIAVDKEKSLNSSHVTSINSSKHQVQSILNTDSNKKKPENSNYKTHVSSKVPDPHETLLLRPISNVKISRTMLFPYKSEKPKSFQKPYSALDLEQILKQMEIESEVSMNMERSANKLNRSATAADMSKPIFPGKPHSHPPPFLPTVPPENNHYPQEDIPDYDQNNVHQPVHTLDPALAGLPPGLHITSGDDNKRLSVLSLQGDSPTSIKMLFGLPSVLVGLKGSIDLRYTDTDDPDISQWYSQVFAPADEVLTTPRLEFRLTGLKPSTTYKIRGKLYLHSIPVEPESEILTVRTQDLPTIATVEEKRREIDCKLTVLDVNDTTAHLAWRHFTEDELMLIDGIQVRYRSTGSPLYSMTELLHHSRSTAELTDLRPGSMYEASLVLMPPPRATTELFDSGKVEFKTAPYIDPYNWTVEVEVREVGAEAVELTWGGVPAPAEKWVRVYRAAHDCGARRDHDAFRLATRESQPTITLTGLEADTKCRVWLDLFLTNGKVKTSNVLEIHTKSLDSSENIDNVIESSSIARGPARGDYYGALVVVGVVAALAALVAVLLLLVVVRRHRPRSVQITSVPSAPRESSLPPYDNPAYKLEIQQETMDL